MNNKDNPINTYNLRMRSGDAFEEYYFSQSIYGNQ